jgi:hypothetical protein
MVGFLRVICPNSLSFKMHTLVPITLWDYAKLSIFFSFWQYRGLTSEFHVCYSGTLPCEPLSHPMQSFNGIMEKDKLAHLTSLMH